MLKNISKKIQQLQKKHGAGAISSYSDIGRGQEFNRFKSGSYMMDKALGGGWPKGKIIELLGEESSGKTTLALHAVAEAQKAGENVVFIDMENSLDPEWAEKIGVNMDDMYFSAPDCAEAALDLLVDLTNTPGVGVIVLDSVAALVPRAELEGKVGDAHVAILARLMGQTLRKCTGTASQNGTTVFFINQTREKIGVMYGDPTTTTGGKALRFFASIRVKCTRSTQIQEQGDTVGNVAKMYVMKNKTAPPFQRAELQIYYDRGISSEAELAQVYLDKGLIDKKGGWYVLPTTDDLQNVLNGTYPPNMAEIIKQYPEDRIKANGFEEVIKKMKQNLNYENLLHELLVKLK